MRKFVLIYALILAVLPSWSQEEGAEEVADTVAIGTGAAGEEGLPWPQNVQHRIDIIVQDALLDVSQMGLLVWDLTADSAIYRYNDRHLLRPASTMKVVTAVTALDRLGGNYLFNTSFYYTGQPRNGTLRGDFVAVGGMDPLLDEADLYAACQALRSIGVDTLRGRLVADLTMKDTLKWGEGWCWDDKNPTLSPLTLGRDTKVLERLSDVLTEAGIWYDTLQLVTSPLPAEATLLCRRHHTLDQALLKMMKESDNFFAECVLYQTAASSGFRPAKAGDAHGLTRRLINRLGLNGGDYRLADGSGLSLYNYVSAELLVALLRHGWRHQEIFQHLLPALPIAGQDGTLKKRMTRSAAEGNVRAKTGTLTGITSLAGYCTAPNGHDLCFAIINQGVLRGRQGRAVQDRICQAMCGQ